MDAIHLGHRRNHVGAFGLSLSHALPLRFLCVFSDPYSASSAALLCVLCVKSFTPDSALPHYSIAQPLKTRRPQTPHTTARSAAERLSSDLWFFSPGSPAARPH